MGDALSVAASGMHANAAWLAGTASNVANQRSVAVSTAQDSQAGPYYPVDTVQITGSASGAVTGFYRISAARTFDPVQSAVDEIQSLHGFDQSAIAFKTASDMQQKTIDLLA